MSDAMKVQPFAVLLRRILAEYQSSQSIFGIHESLFYTPKADSRFATPDMFGQYLATPIGPAAGPHTQLSQNIVSAWLCGGRFIELKTVQIMDQLEIPRPCIDMEDEGYNVEWSQELRLAQSAHEYINAWAVIHILPRLLGWEGQAPLGTIFNMSVGYTLEGIQSAPMLHFMNQMADASQELAEIEAILKEQFPQFAGVAFPPQLSNSVTLSTMHGCPPDEVEHIARYMLDERRLHTTVKLNPTLLGREAVLRILHEDLGFDELFIPDGVFEHDMCYDLALELIKELKLVAARKGLTFGVKLSNTLAMANRKGALPGDEMYMSGRPLYPVTMNLFYRLVQDCGGDLNVSYSAGAGALNVSTILAAGARPVTVASDLLKPGGYARLRQYLERLEIEMGARGAASLDELAGDRLANLKWAAGEALENPRYKKAYHPFDLPKVRSGLGLFDCIAAPCVEACAVAQDVPEYAWLIAHGEYDRALEVILSRNPLPGVTGYVCTHLCQSHCTRNNYDEPVAIRALKRVAVERGRVQLPTPAQGDRKVAVIGSGPSGLAAASFLALNGVGATIFEAKDRPGGMLAIAPAFRLTQAIVQEDIARITGLGVKIELSHPITTPPEALLNEGFDAVYVACGFPGDARLEVEGAQAQGVYPALEVLERAARAEKIDLGTKVLVIGGGNTAMDAARTAQRLTGSPSTVVYRRSRAEMPATAEEVQDLVDEGNRLVELAAPKRVVVSAGRVVGLECLRSTLGKPGPDGRREPIPVPGSEFTLLADSVIVAIGQRADLAFLEGSAVSRGKNGAIAVDAASGRAGAGEVYAGGDAVHGPAIIIQACADGRRAAEAICAQFGIEFATLATRSAPLTDADISLVKVKRARKEPQQRAPALPIAFRDGFDPVEGTLEEGDARREAARCLQCSSICDKCVEVCPNRANYTYRTTPVEWLLPQLTCRNGSLEIVGHEPFAVTQGRQILHVEDFCNECGNCATFCVHQGKPYAEKPRLFLEQTDFALQTGNAFHLRDNTLLRREDGRESKLTKQDGLLLYENEALSAQFEPDFQVRALTLKQCFAGTFSLRQAAEMALILDGVQQSLGFLVG